MTDKVLDGCRILIVEDDFYQAEDSRDYLTEAGAVIVAAKGHVPELKNVLGSGRIDAALLDINVGGNQSFDLARSLLAERVPFAFLTGYDPEILPEDLQHVPLITKPADPASVVAAIAKLHHGRD